ncbi:MAG: transporter substrate-binding domain-containing protein [Acidaminococcus sp.]|nr:transporter substrate-binding domain-containing protein [Acidaminococcus sp.]MCI2100855.1 transporter substrate-binding domain-containing protein [Acidaminococcus sp.]MCI2115218.1 transporter substrate-binding domain-containing protein [Acidaminococcus sp.]MCI2116649.1 transporter substrate-binding domain-containing protein [Acidaminococcus sp.]
MKLNWKKCGTAVVLSAVMMLGTMGSAFAGKLEDIAARGTIRVGTTGDYRPMSYKNKDTGKYEGFDAELAEKLADSLHVKVEYVPTTWKTLSQDTKDGKFDLALCGITRTFDRERTLTMSDGYLLFGKTILCRAKDAGKFKSLADINKPEVKVMVNPGGTNEKFARANLPKATLLVHEQNAEIPGLVGDGKADIMITETMEARKYVKLNDKLAAPLVDSPFTKSRFGALMAKGDQDFLNYVNFFMAEMETNGTMDQLEKKYID